jgi:putative hydrolase of the HAD superfamily
LFARHVWVIAFQGLQYNHPVPITHLIFDLDDTLYPANNGLWDEIGLRINQYLVEHAGVDPLTVNEKRRHYYLTHGTTLRGLMTDYPDMNPDVYLKFVHDVEDMARYIGPNPALDAFLLSLPLPKVIFTNSDTPHAMRVLNCLGVAHHFPTIVDIRAMGFANKPDPKAYEVLLNTIDAKAEGCLFIEDSLRNLRPAKALGFTTILLGNGLLPDPDVDHIAAHILDAAPIIRKLIATS